MPTTASPNRPLHPRRSRVCYVFLVILTLIFIIAVGFLITWLVTKPKKLHYSLENASVQNFNLTDDNHMSATFKLTIQSHNPNHRISVYYNSVEIYVKFKDQTLAFDTMEPFHQPRMNVTQIDDTLVAQNVAVSKSSGKDLRINIPWERSSLKCTLRRRLGLESRYGNHHIERLILSALMPRSICRSQTNR
ncbi:unnamed protein product [Brassica napus]|nr:unnamed protein product [Brassica napus]